MARMIKSLPAVKYAGELCRTFEFECFNSQMTSFYVFIAEQILINLQYMDRESQSLFTSTGFASVRCVIQIV